MFSLATTDAFGSGLGILAYNRLATSPTLVSVGDSRKLRRRFTVEQIDSLIMDVLGDDPTYRRHCRRIALRQDRLKPHLTSSAWGVYLAVEEAEIERLTYALDRLAEEALARRRRSSRK